MLAVQKCDKHPLIALTVAKSFWRERKFQEAKKWLLRSVSYDKDFGDAWAYLYKFQLENGTPEEQQEIVRQCVEASPHHGDLWISISKEPTNLTLKTEEILKLSSKKIPPLWD